MKRISSILCLVPLIAASAYGQMLTAGIVNAAGSNQVAKPTDSPGAGTYTSTQTVTLSDATAGSTICYTTDGSTPGAATPGTCDSSPTQTYSGGFSVAATTTVKAIGTKAAMINSGVLTSIYTITPIGSFVTSAQAKSANANTATTSTVDTSGATLLVCACGMNGTSCTITDSKSNTWQVPAGGTNVLNGWGITTAYAYNPTVGAGHTFTATATGLKPVIGCVAFGGTLTTSGVFDAATSHDTAAASANCQAGSITPAAANSVWFSAASNTNPSATSLTINLGFTALTTQVADITSFGGNAGYLIDTGTAARNPTWTANDASNWQKCATAVFKTQ